jgi:GNAT superfamily N-acetyltransferase
MEDNEWSFCALWTEKFETGCARALVNKRLAGDYFFNRATVEGCKSAAAKEAEKIAKEFWDRRTDCYLYFRSERPPQTATMKKIDTMRVYKSYSVAQEQQNRVGSGGRTIQVAQVTDQSKGRQIWTDVFCGSFGVPEWRDEVKRITNEHFHKLVLLLAYKDGRPAGCAALYEKEKGGMVGLYCLGTLAGFRGAGIAKAILRHARSRATSSGSILFLQTLESEGLSRLYEKSGFKIAYKKDIFLLLPPKPASAGFRLD